MFFSELNREASEIAGCFSSRVQRLLHLHVPSGLQRYIWRIRRCFIDDHQLMAQEGRMLLNYVTMNAIAIRKILKKYDKVSTVLIITIYISEIFNLIYEGEPWRSL
jgi:E3 ubiquitin-protein ligase BAH